MIDPGEFERIAVDTCDACMLAPDRHVLHRAVEAALIRAYLAGLNDADYLVDPSNTNTRRRIDTRMDVVSKKTGVTLA